MRWLSSQKKKMAYLYYQRYFGSLTTRGRIDPPADYVRQEHPPRRDPLWEISSPVWRLRLLDPRKQSFSSPGYPPSWRRSFPRLEWAVMGARVHPYYPPRIFLQGLRGRKRTAFEDPETKASKREKKSPPEGPASEGAFAAQSPRGDQPSNES